MSEFLHVPLPDFDLWMTTAYAEVHAERQRAHDKHDKPTSPSMEGRPWDDPCWRDVLVEEVGEVAKAFNDHRHDEAPDDAVLMVELRKELVQVAAMACAWIDALDGRQSTWLRAVAPAHAPRCASVLGEGMCHCGDALEGHSLADNHAPVPYACDCGAER